MGPRHADTSVCIWSANGLECNLYNNGRGRWIAETYMLQDIRVFYTAPIELRPEQAGSCGQNFAGQGAAAAP